MIPHKPVPRPVKPVLRAMVRPAPSPMEIEPKKPAGPTTSEQLRNGLWLAVRIVLTVAAIHLAYTVVDRLDKLEKRVHVLEERTDRLVDFLEKLRRY